MLLVWAMLLGDGARASEVYPGCTAPPARSGHAFYVDPVRGSRQGDGSQAHPWRTFSEVVADGLISTAPMRPQVLAQRLAAGTLTSPVKPGDTLYLMSGDHGAVLIQGWFGRDLIGYDNPEFITVAAYPGQTPVLQSLTMKGGGKWRFTGLTLQSLNTSGRYALGGTATPDVFLVALKGPHHDIVIDRFTLQSAADVSAWSGADWRSKRMSGILDDKGGQCVAITDNRLRNIGFGIQTQRSDKVLIARNQIDHFVDDGIDYGSSDLLIEHNRILNSIEDGDGFHRDGMQGQPADAVTPIENVAIRDNLVIRIADPALRSPGHLQGIDTFDGVWRNMSVERNTVVTNAMQGLSFYGVDGIRIAGNVLVADSGRMLQCLNVAPEVCDSREAAIVHDRPPSIALQPAKTRRPSQNGIIEDNIATGIQIHPTTQDVVVRNNLCLPTDGKCVIGMPIGGRMTWVGKPGEYGDHNLIPGFEAKDLFVRYDTRSATYDLRLKRANPALRRGRTAPKAEHGSGA